MAGLVASKSHGDGNDGSGDVDGYGVQLGLDLFVSHVSEDGGHEEGEALDCDVDEEESSGADVIVDVEEGAADVGGGHFGVGRRTGL